MRAVTFIFAATIAACAVTSGDDVADSEAASTKIKNVTKADREKYLAQGQVWSEEEFGKLASKDLLTGPGGKDSFPAQRVKGGGVEFPSITCDFVEPKKEHELGGRSPKFQCASNGTTLKVKYGKDADSNGELYGEVIAGRLLWALGFVVDDVYPVRVTCKNCPADPWDIYDNFEPNQGERAERVFNSAIIERKYAGPKIEQSNWPDDADSQGFGFDEVDSARQHAPGIGAPNNQWRGFELLAAFIKHADNKAANQRLACSPDGVQENGTCSAPILMMQDLGATFGGGAGFLGRIGGGTKARLENWRDSPVWKNHDKCQADLSSRFTLSDPTVDEPSRAFLASLLEKVTDAQLTDIFLASRIVERGEEIDGKPVTIADWVATFRAKLADLQRPCR